MNQVDNPEIPYYHVIEICLKENLRYEKVVIEKIQQLEGHALVLLCPP